MRYNLLDFFKSLEDPRRGQGQRHKFEHILVIMIMAILSGHQGIRGFTRFARANSEDLTRLFKLKHGVPGFSTFRSMVNTLNDQLVSQKFIEWVKSQTPESTKELIALDGKSIRSTASGGQHANQNFAAVVSAFGHSSGLIYGMQAYENGKSGEAQALRELVEALGLKGVTFTMDALHAQKKP